VSDSSNQPLLCRLRKEPWLTAWLVTDENLDAVAAWCGGRVDGRDIDRPEVAVPLEDDQYGAAADWAEPGQYVVRGVTGKYFVVDAERFDQDYEVTAFDRSYRRGVR
jgi:hypothetical protein